MTLLIVLGVVVLLTVLVAVSMSWSKNDRSRMGKLVHNLTVQELAESTLQFGRGYYAQNYAAWNTHLAYFVSARTVAQVKAWSSASLTRSGVTSTETFFTTGLRSSTLDWTTDAAPCANRDGARGGNRTRTGCPTGF